LSSDLLTLGFDTSAAHCAAALLSGDRLIAEAVEPMDRGQAERLIPLLEQMLTDAGVGWRDLAVIGVGTGPGNFTGIRIGVAAARGLALGLGVPAHGVTGFEARETLVPADMIAAIPAPRDQVHVADPLPRLIPRDTAGPVWADACPAGLAAAIARIAAARGNHPGPAPAPLYVRPADAAPARDQPPVLLD
jgi:hypothetical protein